MRMIRITSVFFAIFEDPDPSAAFSTPQAASHRPDCAGVAVYPLNADGLMTHQASATIFSLPAYASIWLRVSRLACC